MLTSLRCTSGRRRQPLASRLIELTLLLSLAIHAARHAEGAADNIADELHKLDSRVLTHDQATPKLTSDDLQSMLSRDIRSRQQAVNAQNVTAWRTISNRDLWEQHREAKIAALKRSLGAFPDPPDDLRVRVTRSLSGDGFVIDCLVFESRPGLLVTANLYRPAKSRESMPGILICHSHHNPKTEGELQDMGMMWARAGCFVLIMDQVDLLLDQPGIDPERIILLGAVAGGGDPAAVTTAIDDRIKAVVPFNFSGPQPETVFPLPDDAELSFNYVGGGSWESTRNLRLSARDGFLPWTIVAAIAPRRLLYAHEFEWDRDNDPVWKRLESIFGMYDRRDYLSSLKGYGGVQLSSSEASHCNNIGGHHRAQIHPAFQRWFNIAVSEPDFRDRRESSELLCVEDVATDKPITLRRVHELAGSIADQRLRSFREPLNSNPKKDRAAVLRNAWSEVLGGVTPTPARNGAGRRSRTKQ